MDILEPLLCTLASETLLFPVLKRRKDTFCFLLFVLMNVVSNVGMNSLYIYVFDRDTAFIYIAEVFVFLGESLILYRLDRRRFLSFLAGIMANALSLVVGLCVLFTVTIFGSLVEAAIVFACIFAVEILLIFLYQFGIFDRIKRRIRT